MAHASKVIDFNPISLCNVFYKIINKILANQIIEVNSFIIHPSQASFIKEILFMDNIILANEIMRDFFYGNIGEVFYAKVDIKKPLIMLIGVFLLEDS